MLLEDKSFIKNIKKEIIESFVAILLIIIFAVVVLKNPENFITVAVQIFGYVAIFMGILNIFFYYRLPEEAKMYSKNLMTGTLLITCGFASFFVTNILKEMITILLGGYLLFQNASRIQLSMQIKPYTKKLWMYLLGASLINSVISILLIINPFAGKFEFNTYISVLLLVVECILFLENIFILIGVKKPQEEK